ncbi:MAG: serine/threonine protein kinase [Victivallales bacterium]|nr:serine/threonine protein kinase [Victivallales bacterium]
MIFRCPAVEFEIVDQIAKGGMGTIYKAIQKGADGFEKTVAIKTLNPDLARQTAFRDMFISEAKLVANLVHENIVQVYQLEYSDGIYFFVLEHVNGIALDELLGFVETLNQLLPTELSVFIISRIARGLAYAHNRRIGGESLRIVHCDLSPNNILISTEGVVKTTDFGIARAATMSVMSDDRLMGKIPFMSPEQARGDEIDFRSDIYSLGVLLFHMLSGRFPREVSSSDTAMLKAAELGEIAWELCPKLEEGLSTILRRMLAADPAARYDKTGELARDLEYFIYRKGYGPTNVTLSEYLRIQVPYIFEDGVRSKAIRSDEKTVEMTGYVI